MPTTIKDVVWILAVAWVVYALGYTVGFAEAVQAISGAV